MTIALCCCFVNAQMARQFVTRASSASQTWYCIPMLRPLSCGEGSYVWKNVTNIFKNVHRVCELRWFSWEQQKSYSMDSLLWFGIFLIIEMSGGIDRGDVRVNDTVPVTRRRPWGEDARLQVPIPSLGHWHNRYQIIVDWIVRPSRTITGVLCFCSQASHCQLTVLTPMSSIDLGSRSTSATPLRMLSFRN